MQVLFDTIIYSLQNKGGISRVFSELIPRLMKLDSSLEISYLITSKLIQPLPNYGTIPIYDISFIERLFSPRRLWSDSYPIIKSFFTKIIYRPSSNSIFHSTYYTDVNGWKGKKVVSVHDMVYEKFPGLYSSKYDKKFRIIKKKVILSADSIICISKSTKNDLIEEYHIPDKNIEIIYLGTPSSFSRMDPTDIPREFVVNNPFILFVGKRTHNKNFHNLFEAYRKWNKNKDINLFVVGEKWNDEESKLIVQYNLENKISLFEHIDDIQLCYLYNQAAAFIYPSLYEGFGLPLLEAMTCGCTIVASRIPSTIEIAQNIPLYFEIGDIDSLINSLDQTLEDFNLLSRKENGQNRARDFSWDNSAKNLYSIYKDIQ